MKINTIDGIMLAPMMIQETRLYHWFLNKTREEKFTQSKLAALFGISASDINKWIHGKYAYINCAKIAEITGITEPELVVELACMKKEKGLYDREVIDIELDLNQGLYLSPLHIKSTRFYHWYQDQKRAGENQSSLAKSMGVSAGTFNKWVNEAYTYKDCANIAAISNRNEGELILELVALRKYINR